MDQGGSQSSRTSPDNVPLFRSNILEDPRPDRGEPEQGGTVARAVPKLGVLSEAMDQYQFPEDDE